MVTRRDLLTYSGAFAALSALGISPGAMAAGVLKLGNSETFNFQTLIARAKALAAKPYEKPTEFDPSLLSNITYDAYMKTVYKPEYALFKNAGRFPVTFFMVNGLHRMPVKMHVVENNAAREIIQNIDYFTTTDKSVRLPALEGNVFSGFRVLASQDALKTNPQNDWISFMGASYFRAIGELGQFGLSARGIALNTVQPGVDEEFPDFTDFWFEAPKDDSKNLTVYALLNGPSITGAYKFILHRGKGVVQDVECTLFLRKDIQRFGIAPLTSMYWFSKTVKGAATDWRPEVHDSDGLAMWTGSGEHLWRPLNNPLRVVTSSFHDENPRGFGLLQKDRNFDSYLDAAHYERRPDLWVEPLGKWGKGSVQLVEIPTDDEIYDNIVAMWVPDAPAKAGDEHHFHYRLHWLSDEPYPSTLARCGATRLGRGGVPGSDRPHDSRKFTVEFHGGNLNHLPSGVAPEAVLSASRGTFENVLVSKLPDDSGNWLAQFDLVAGDGDPVELKLYLKAQENVVSETWCYQYHPFNSPAKPWPVACDKK
ncbi:glucans biosynthesis protein [Pantoea sp. PNA 14-12]|uniref:glucan biosynthesis protein n=1 Tax=Pantoea TaxID=53335 RepID=UPI000510078E|nr:MULTISPECIES: glucan biosynthesis protein D [Pantoea]KGD83624.1 glucan biosynthesis protein D [Pantoea stewartii subsp. indologenes]MBC0856223.1 glucan biosynthesis protein D [Pantoea stewartii]MCU7366905.1 glucan biosynthesis protein D [Pantoea stewartii]MDF7786589.1 glucan biosynthesis protein D [Pantoea stewartii]MEB6536080.1 glucan biosynthesis protein D [Pantoea stewartii]